MPVPSGAFVFWLAIVGGIVAYNVSASRLERRRGKELRCFLEEHSFVPSALPARFPFAQLAPRIAHGKVFNCYEGTFNKRRAVAADVRVGQGKGSYSQTFVAVQQVDATPYNPPRFLTALALEYSQEGSWVLGTIPKQTLEADAVKGFLECFT